MNKRLILILTTVLASVLLLTSCGTGSNPPTASVGKQAPDFQLPNLEGETASLNDFKGKPILLNFWASWCGPCRYEMPYMQDIYEEWPDNELVLMTINLGDSPAKVQEFLQTSNLSLPVLLDSHNEVAKQYAIQYLPTTFFIDKDGVIQEKIVGAFQNKAQIETNLSKIIAG